MSHNYRENIENNRDPRRRDRSRSDVRRTDHDEPTFTSDNQQQSSSSANSNADLFKTLGLNAQLIQTLTNTNPPKIEQPIHAQEFASFLSQSYGLSHPPVINRGNLLKRE